MSRGVVKVPLNTDRSELGRGCSMHIFNPRNTCVTEFPEGSFPTRGEKLSKDCPRGGGGGCPAYLQAYFNSCDKNSPFFYSCRECLLCRLYPLGKDSYIWLFINLAPMAT
ncbi:hypothetical protein CEXT_488061 [Caerostris extrusa]|uniref:Uncharacterized protein n=1 Tax=Caerostris extrusa TaxID=172846 RepID=A0AAV4PV59_CAEEX|nr:hypothetical protein CEXT_488061 [Caerostris extrusa]